MSQNNRLKYYISFEADTKKAKSQIDEMMRSLQQINTPKNIMNELISGEDLSQARARVNQLQAMLQNAVNVDTGRLDLSKFNRSLQNSNITLSQFRKSFSQLGEEGRNAFQQITRAVLDGEAPLKQQNALFNKMADTMKNTIRWQISATALQAFTSSIRNAYKYAEDLNRSLNDIRIVTGQSVEQMDAFAERANKSARELRTTTKAYTDAALIFYQQGLDDNEVLERTNAVMKMANVTGESASDVSSYMTAIWNNFDDGSKSLEYYGDVITKLGAATAASSEEIAGGLEKFAAIGDTVGLSYEYAASALATIVDQTRQSEDVVGTSLRTIFARLSSLSLGETLEDGVDLTKYTEALDKVGVKVLDQNGQLKEMDTILDELGAKWGDLDSAQKSALATTVAGVRQYSQLIALMDNYDLFKVNVELALDSEGTLTEQSEIFEESWLGAKRRVTAALEGIYDTLLDDKVFIFITNGIASIIEGVDWLIDRAGGLPSAISFIGLAVQHLFGKEIKQVISDVFYSIETYTGQTQRKIADLMQTMAQQNQYIQAEYDTSAGIADSLKREADWKAHILKTQQAITEQRRVELSIAQLTNSQYAEAIKLIDEQMAKAQQSANAALKGFTPPNPQAFKTDINSVLNNDWSILDNTYGMSSKAKLSYMKKVAGDAGDQKLLDDLNGVGDLRTAAGKDNLNKLIADNDKNVNLQASAVANFYAKDLEDQGFKSKDLQDYIVNSKELIKQEDALTERKARQEKALKRYHIAVDENNTDAQAYYGSEVSKADEAVINRKNKINDLNSELDKTDPLIKNFAQNMKPIESSTVTVQEAKENLTSMFGRGFSGAMKMTMGLSSAYSALQALGDESLSVGQKMTRFAMSMTIAIPQLKAAVGDFQKMAKTFGEFKIPTAWTQEGSIFAKLTGGATTLKAALTALAPTIAAVSMGIIAVYAIWKKIEAEKIETKIKQAEERAKKVASTVSELNKEFAELKNTLSGFNDSYNAIEDMVVGTLEWRNAVSELNNQLLDVIKNYDLIEGTDYYIDEQGIARLTETGQNKATEQAQKRIATASLASASASIEVDQLNAQKAQQDAKKSFSVNAAYSKEALDSSSELIDKLIKDAAEKGVVPEFEELKKQFVDLGAIVSDNNLQGFIDQLQNVSDTAGKAQSSLALAYGSTVGAFASSKDVSDELMPEYTKAQGAVIDEWLNNKAGEYQKAGVWNNQDNLKAVSDILGEDLKYDAFSNTAVYTDENNKKQKLTAEEIADYLAARDFENQKESVLESSHNESLLKAQEAEYGHLYDKETLDSKDDLKRQKKTAANAAKSDLDEEQVATYKKYLEEVEKISSDVSEDMAVANIRFNKGMSDLLDNWDEYKQKLNASNKGTAEYVETLDTLRNTMSEILNVDSDKITEDFLTNAENMALMEQAYLGNVDAIGELQKKMTDSLIDGIDGLKDETLAEFDSILAEMNLNSEDIEIGMSLDDEAVQAVYGDFVDLMNSLLESGAMTADQVTEILNGINLTPDIDYEEIEDRSTSNIMSTGYILNKDGEYQKVTSETQFDSTTKIYVPKINAKSTKVSGKPKDKLDSTNKTKGAKNASSRKQDLKKADDEIERYHLIKETIEDLNKELDRLGKQKNRAWGQAHIDLIDQEIAKTKEAISAQEEYLRQIGANLEGDKAKIAGFGAQFDEDGRITNYEQLMQDQINKYNAAIQSGNETRIETAKEQYEEFKKALSQYEETADLMEDEYQKLLDMQNEVYDKLLEQIEYKIEIDVKLSEDADKFFDFMLGLIEDQAYSAAESLAYLGKKADEALGRINSYQDGIKSLLEGHGLDGEAYERFLSGDLTMEELQAAGFSADDIGALQEWRNALIDEIESLRALQKTVTESIGKTFDEYMDTMDRLIGKFDHLRNVTNAYNNIVDLVGKKALGISNQMLKDMNDAVLNNSVNSLKSAKEKLEVAQNAQEEISKLAEKQREYLQNAENASTEAERRYWRGLANDIGEEMEHIEDSAEEAEEQFLQSWEAALEDARSIFEDNVQMAMESFEDAISGIYGSIDAMREAYDQNKTLRDQYLEEYERIYELNKLNRDITNSMDDIDSIAAKQELKKLQEEINELQRSGAQISEYDMKMLRMKYELRLAEIALEDAQNAKSQVRMSRDNDGNWSYVYTADEATVADAQQSYEDKMYEMQNTSNEYLDQISEQWMQATAEMERAYQKIYEDRTLSDEERAAAINRLYDYYTSRFNFFNDQIGNALENNKTLYESDWQDWAAKNNIQIQSNNSFQTSFDDTILGITTGLTDVRQFHQELNNAMGKPGGGGLIGDLDEAYSNWQKNVSDIMEAAGTSVEGFAGTYQKKTEEVREESDKTAQSVSDLADDADQAFSDIVQYVSDWYDEYAGAIGDAIQQNVNMIQSIDALIAKLKQLKAEQGQPSGGSSGGGGGTTSNNSNGGGNNTTPTKQTNAKKPYRVIDAIQGNILIERIEFTDSEAADYERKNQHVDLIALATGGYTGEWGNSSGKLALLHEKELVLNKDDTENLLTTIDMVRKIMELTDLKASISGLGIGALSANALGGTNSTIEQEITIYADFPNATDYEEIKAAFHDLINRASQYAHRDGGVYGGMRSTADERLY